MPSPKISKASKWFNNSNKSFKISFQRLRLSSSSLRRRQQQQQQTISSYQSPKAPISPESPPDKTNTREDELKQVFCHFDSDGDEKISALELRNFFASIGEYVSHEDAQGVIDQLDSDGDEMLDFDDFLRLMKRESDDQEDDLKKAFEMFELQKGDGCITPRGLQRMLKKLGDAKSYDECVAMIQVYDTDGNGVLDFHEFNQMMMA